MQTIEKIKASIPEHLRQYVVDQHTIDYSAEDQAVWRYILRQLKDFLQVHAHECYLDGLEKTGITVNEIPSIDQICRKLQAFGWSAVPVSGFIPPAAFMELQSLGILPIAAEMRSIDHISYTPAPDIVHEAAGHAPILIDPKFATYLRSYAEVAKRAILSREDLEQYEAIRDLSDRKEHPASTPEEIRAAETRLEKISSSMSFISEAALLGRMNWWTAEYGLIGDLKAPKIYGAGLLSSIGEAKNCLQDKVKKIPLAVDCIDFSYDITEQQPQLFVAQTFDELPKVLAQLAEQLAFRRGGVYGLEKAIQAETVNTVQLNSGLQIAGLLTEIKVDANSKDATFFRFSGPTQLCVKGVELAGQGRDYHAQGFSSPVGRLKGQHRCLSDATSSEQEKLGFVTNGQVDLEFESGIRVVGKFINKVSVNGKLLVVTLAACRVSLGDEILFEPTWGDFDLAVGSSVTSVFAGPADRKAFGMTANFAKKTVPLKRRSHTAADLDKIYNSIRKMRKANSVEIGIIKQLVAQLRSDFPAQWLPRLEIYELIARGWLNDPQLGEELKQELLAIAKTYPEKKAVIADGLAIAMNVY